jgi:hypothetical protein
MVSDGGRAADDFQSNFSPRTPKYRAEPRSTRDQRARRINKIENPAKSAKPPSPVQIRAAPPIQPTQPTSDSPSVFCPLKLVQQAYMRAYQLRADVTGSPGRTPPRAAPIL